MENFETTLDAACLQVFGMISAAVSHDLKNVLAIVNESAGLLDDLSLRAAKGIEIPPDRLGAATERILRQVKRGDAVLKNLNRFAHSTDVPVGRVNVSEMVQLVVDLAGRQVAMKELAVTVAPSESVVSTCVVYLEALVYLLLRQVIDTLPRKETVEIGVGGQGQMVEVRLVNPGGLQVLPDADFPGVREQALMQWLGAEMIVEQGMVTLRLPENVNR
jgi:C4-dicarboxylate-specific signal transduction histidine kinase